MACCMLQILHPSFIFYMLVRPSIYCFFFSLKHLSVLVKDVPLVKLSFQEVFDENPDIIIHQDLMDCQLCVCTPAVPPLFTDNFDYSSLDDFVRGILINEEVSRHSVPGPVMLPDIFFPLLDI